MIVLSPTKRVGVQVTTRSPVHTAVHGQRTLSGRSGSRRGQTTQLLLHSASQEECQTLLVLPVVISFVVPWYDVHKGCKRNDPLYITLKGVISSSCNNLRVTILILVGVMSFAGKAYSQLTTLSPWQDIEKPGQSGQLGQWLLTKTHTEPPPSMLLIKSQKQALG